MKTKSYGILFHICRLLVRIVYPRYEVKHKDNNPQPVVYISHHQNLFGPFIVLLWYPLFVRTWILSVFFKPKECFNQYVNYTFTQRFNIKPFFAKLFAFPISIFITSLMKSAMGIPVYRNSRNILKTFQLSIEALKNGENIIIYPDIDYSSKNSEVTDLYEGYLYLEKYYYKETKNHITFVPLYVSKKKRLIITGEPIQFLGKEPFKIEQKKISREIKNRLNELAKESGDIE